MEKDKSLNIGGTLLPPSGRMNFFGNSTRNNFGIRQEASGSPSNSNSFSNDISKMPDNPLKLSGHRRAHSEILTLPDDISSDSDLGVVGGFNRPWFSDETEEDLLSMYLDMDKFNSSSVSSGFQVGNLSESVILHDENENVVEKPMKVRHEHSQSMDGSDETSSADGKKSISDAKLAELALVDPKRAKRIWANRQSAARSKERKMRYIGELERKVQTLQTEATSLSGQLTLMQRDTTSLTADNSGLKLRLQTMEQKVHLQDALNEALKEEIRHLKVLIGQNATNGGQLVNYNASSSFGSKQQPQFYPNSNNISQHRLFTPQQLQIQSQKQQHNFQQQRQLRQFQYQQQQQQEQQSSDLN